MQFGTFFDGELTRQERICLTSFCGMGHEVSVFSYGTLDLPANVRRVDARSILPKSAFFRIDAGPPSHRGSVAPFANLFRYRMIRETGLTWIDTDVICLQRNWPDQPMLMAWQGPCLINNAVLRLPADHPLLDDAIEAATRMGRFTIWAYTGPFLLTALVQQYELTESVLPSESFYPIHWAQAATLIEPLPPEMSIRWPRESYCVHLWNEHLRTRGYDKAAGPPPDSALARILEWASSTPQPTLSNRTETILNRRGPGT